MKTTIEYLTLNSLFSRGEYAKYLVEYASAPPEIRSQQAANYLGALVFLGRSDEAEAHFAAQKGTGSTEAAGLFYLIIARVRTSRYAQAKQALISLFKIWRTQKNDKGVGFFCCQSFAFYRFYQSRYRLSLAHSKRAYAKAYLSQNKEQMVLSLDSLGMNLILTGSIGQGLERLRQARALAGEMGNASHEEALRVTETKMETRHEFPSMANVSKISSLEKDLFDRDDYSRAELMLHKLSLLILRGDFRKAWEEIPAAAKIVYGSQNRRQVAKLNLRMAYLQMQQGNYIPAFALIHGARLQTDEAFDLPLHFQLLTLEWQILKAQGETTLASKLADKIQSKAAEKKYHDRILQRHGLCASRFSYRTGEDPLGDLLDEVHLDHDPRLLPKIRSAEALSLAYDLKGLNRGEPILAALPKSMVVLGPERCFTFSTAGQILNRALIALRKRTVSKESFVYSVWGYRYQARHEPMLQRTLQRLRSLLKEYGTHLRSEGSSIALSMRSVAWESDPTSEDDSWAIEPLESEDGTLDPSLNVRQIRLLQRTIPNRPFSRAQFARQHKISTMTAWRDLDSLVKRGHLIVIGKGRIRRYLLKEARK